ncbi:MAG: exosortase [Nitrospirae bacterium]|nr:exosortase [Nitrospirota bacterium]
MKQRNLLFIFFFLVIAAIFYAPVKNLLILSLRYNELYSHIVLIPFVSMYFIYIDKNKIFSNIGYSAKAGIPLIIIGVILFLWGKTQGSGFNQNDYLSLMTSSAIVMLIGGFVLFYGLKAFKAAMFPLFSLVFMIPVPSLIMDSFIAFLQRASTEVAYILFTLTGVSFLREGFVFHLQGISVEVAEQCSGIRSSLALFITSIIAGKMFLNTSSRKVILALSVFPITVFKNGVRIVTLTLLGMYVDPRILDSNLHKRGGIPIFILAIMLLLSVLWILRKSEAIKKKG